MVRITSKGPLLEVATGTRKPDRCGTLRGFVEVSNTNSSRNFSLVDERLRNLGSGHRAIYGGVRGTNSCQVARPKKNGNHCSAMTFGHCTLVPSLLNFQPVAVCGVGSAECDQHR